MKKLLLICMLIGWLLPEAFAQGQVTGKVVDSEEGAGIPGVNVRIKNTTTGVVTDLDGNYSINVPGPDAVLSFSFIGYILEEIEVGNRSTLNVSLTADLQQLDEVIVVGYGTQKKSDITGAVSSISGEKMRNTITTSADQALQGRIPGVQVTQNSGTPGGATSIRVRGTSSITGSNEPLYVIDGIQVSGEGQRAAGFDWSGGAGGQQNNSVSPLASISPNDIESIEVLKDASATAIYGSRAANGVVIITTKRGKSGEAKISYDGFYSLQQVPRKLDMMNLQEYAAFNTSIANQTQGIEANERFRDPSLLGHGTDWQDAVFEVAPIQSHQISVSGGSEKSTYAIMGGVFMHDGIVTNSNFDRFNIRANLDNQVKSWLKVGANIAYTNTDQTMPLSDGGDGVIANALQMPPSIPVRNIDGSFAGPPVGQGSAQVSANPVALARQQSNTLERQTIMSNFYMDAQIIEGLSFRTEIGFNSHNGVSNSFVPTYDWGAIRNDVSQLLQRRDTQFDYIFKNYFTYTNQWGAHGLTAMVGTEAVRAEYEGSELFKINLATNDIITPNQGDNSPIPTTGWAGANSLNSYFGRATHNFDERFITTFTLRADGSSRFGENYRWGYFPSGAVAWRIANERFMPQTGVLSDLKIRASVGLIGNQAIPNYAFGSAFNNINTAFGMGYMNQRLGNPDLRWESTREINLGIDAAFLDGRINLAADIYHRYTDDMLLQVAIPNYMGGGAGGIGAPFANVGSVENRGVELGLNTINVNTSNFTWSSDVMFTLNRNQITALDRHYYRGLYWYAGFDEVTRTSVGQPVGTFYGYKTEGIFTSQEDIQNHAVQVGEGTNFIHERDGVWLGDIKFQDLNGDGVIDSNDKTVIGDPNPDFIFSLNNSFNIGRFDATIFLQGVYGIDVFNFQRARNEQMLGIFDNQAATVANRAQYQLIDPAAPANIENVQLINPDTDMPRFAQLNVNANDRMSDRWIEDGSFLRIQNITIGYTLPNALMERMRIDNLRVYVNAQNLYTFTNYTGYDPEIGAFEQDALRQNIDMGRIPAPRMMTVGLQLGF